MTLNSNLPKKRGRPLGSTNKRTRTIAGKEYTFKDKKFKQVAKKVAPEDQPFKQNSKVKVALKTIVEGLVDEINRQRTIISYLEDKLESK